MKRHVIFTLLLFGFFGAFAQSISVKSFQPLPMDMTASSLDGKRLDPNGKAAALIKVVTVETGFTFEGGKLGVVDAKQQMGEVWVWVPQGMRKMTVRHQKYGVLENFYFPLDIESERTYEMILAVAKEGDAPNQVKRGAVSVKSNVPSAFYIDDQLIGNTPMYYADLACGDHTIKFVKEGYSDYTDTIHVEEDDIIQVKGMLETVQSVGFKCNVADADLYIDGKKVGKASEKYNLKFGNYAVRVSAPSHDDFNGTITVDKTTATIPIYLTSTEYITVNGVTFAMKKIDGGRFVMGSDDAYAAYYEKPMHTVILDGFYMGETEVTQALWKAVMGNNPSYFIGDDLPVQKVSWNDCQRFITKLNQLTNKKFRLPTEAEWEYAARGGTTTSLYSGEDIVIIKGNESPNLDPLGWYAGNSGRDYTRSEGCDTEHYFKFKPGMNPYGDRIGGVHPVGKKKPNAYGLYDMLGNVIEWCSDHREQYTANTQTNPTFDKPLGTIYKGSGHVLRGGSCGGDPELCRVSARSGNHSDDESAEIVGFRIVLDQK